MLNALIFSFYCGNRKHVIIIRISETVAKLHEPHVANPPLANLGRDGRDRGTALPSGISRLLERGHAAQFCELVLLLI